VGGGKSASEASAKGASKASAKSASASAKSASAKRASANKVQLPHAKETSAKSASEWSSMKVLLLPARATARSLKEEAAAHRLPSAIELAQKTTLVPGDRCTAAPSLLQTAAHSHVPCH
jgi:hypothetical protein